MALFIPAISGENHAERAISGGHAVLDAVRGKRLAAKDLVVAAGIHTGNTFVGVLGSDEKTDFTALGDTVNVAARLGGMAVPMNYS